MSFLTLASLTKAYGSFVAVDGISLAIERGEFVSFLGPSGCGKTTTLQMIAGLTPPTAGTVVLGGRDITQDAPNKRGLGVVFQSYALFPHMTVAENVSFGLEMRKIARAERDRQVADTLSLVRLSEMADRYPRQLSGGQRQRVAVARALVIKPPVLLLDEPLSNLDAKLREEMQFELRRIQQSVGTTTIMVTHDQAEALSISDRVVVMEKGRITQVDAPYRLYEQPATPFISDFVGKMTRLHGIRRAGGVEVAGRLLPAGGDAGEGGAVDLLLRPEKIEFAAAGQGMVDGRVVSRFFFGSYWLFAIETAAGLATVSLPNQDEDVPREGENVALRWAPASARVVSPEGAEP
ncbi:MAG: ABC transporter ATP-binding protein [Proteobacteria bacterium]|nr:ABC transporter ATP-binding protein [Pseudomonadota bacterium]